MNLLAAKYPGIIGFILKRRQTLVNIYVFINVAGFFGWSYYKNPETLRFDFIEMAYLLHNVIMVVLFLVRKNYKSIDNNLFHQAVAAFAFFSGLAFLGQAQTADPTLLLISRVLIGASWTISIATLLNLGRSFGVLIALREVKTGGLYSIVRHPMYATDLLFRIGFAVSHVTVPTMVLLILTIAAYVYRALLEERFLTQAPEYREYMLKVKYRFVPYIY